MAITKEQAVQWSKSKIGQKVDFDGYYGAQCMDLTVAFCVQYFGWRPWGNARDLVTQNIPAGWQRIKNTPDFIPQPGDIFIWAHDKYGHTGIITSANMNSYAAIEQNGEAPYDGSRPAKEYTRNYANFWGVLRPPYAPSGSEPSGKLNIKHGNSTVLVNSLNVRDQPSLKGAVIATYSKGQGFKYDGYIIADGHVWLSYVGGSGKRRYVAAGPHDNNPKNVWISGF